MQRPPPPGAVERHTRAWLADFVVGLNLCPFARPLLSSPALRIRVSAARQPADLQRDFLHALDELQAAPESAIATTLLVFSDALASFEDYLDFVDQAQYLLEQAGLDGIVQLASFHPDYRFAGEAEDAASHYSNRAPWPTLHLLREDMVTRLVTSHPDPEGIPAANIEQLEHLGRKALEARWLALFR
ncbi:DUF1415 domain-containing protein [Parahaliea mediterranea]|uniref:DUF1415 domain-containing protein n=1 Tax=Parahaliea mediterranea TaxID=651086 RepID=UPI000E2F55AA|nr:DUF1415 domain-containing protein [Parahaliea mediterranea]